MIAELAEQGRRAKAASRTLALASTADKDAALHAAADLQVERRDDILAASAEDVARAEGAGTTATVVDRLRLSPERVESMAAGLRQVAALPDPVGQVLEGWTRPNGLRITKVRVPLGVVAIVYETRSSRRARSSPRPAAVARWIASSDRSSRDCARRTLSAYQERFDALL